MKNVALRLGLYLSVFLLLVGGIGILGALHSRANWLSTSHLSGNEIQGVTIPVYQPDKPTVAVVLGNPITEVFDFVVPYEMFAMTDAYNVYAVAPDTQVTSLTGGLDIVPHYSFEQLDHMLGKSPDLIVVPYMPMSDEAKYKPVREWLQKHAETEILSICSGAMNVADAGLLHGKTSTIHWRIVSQAERKFPETRWVRDQRYVQDGHITASAGLTSGIDAVLHVIARQLGEAAAERIADELHYPSYHYVKNPLVEPYVIDRTEAIYYLNLAFQFQKQKTGVLLYDGMEEAALTSVFDTYAPLGTTKILTVSVDDGPVVTQHHLNLVARHHVAHAPSMDRLFVTGTHPNGRSAEAVKKWRELGHGVEPEYIHTAMPDRFVFDATLEDLAIQEDSMTAKWAAKRLEYRGDQLHLGGYPFPLEGFITPLLLGLVAFWAASMLDQRFFAKKEDRNSSSEASIVRI